MTELCSWTTKAVSRYMTSTILLYILYKSRDPTEPPVHVSTGSEEIDWKKCEQENIWARFDPEIQWYSNIQICGPRHLQCWRHLTGTDIPSPRGRIQTSCGRYREWLQTSSQSSNLARKPSAPDLRLSQLRWCQQVRSCNWESQPDREWCSWSSTASPATSSGPPATQAQTVEISWSRRSEENSLQWLPLNQDVIL